MKCPSCGAETRAANFCEFCGCELPKKEEPSQTVNVTNNYYGSDTTGKSIESSKSSGAVCPKCGGNHVNFKREKVGSVGQSTSKRSSVTKRTKGQTVTQSVWRTVGVCQDCGYTWNPNGSAAPKKKHGLIWWFFAICFFPVSLSVLFWKTNKIPLKKPIKAAILAIVWIFLLASNGNSNKEQPDTASPSVQTEAATEVLTEATTEATTEVITETEIITEAVTETESVTEAVTETETELATEATTEVSTEVETKKYSLLDSVEVRPMMNGTGTEKIGDVAIVVSDSKLCTKEVLEDFYFNYVEKNKCNYYIILFDDKDKKEGVYINNGLIEVGAKFAEDGDLYMLDGETEDAVYYIPDSDGKTLKEWVTEEETEPATEEAVTDVDTVKQAQEALNALGYDCGTPDGKAGKATAAAILAYASAKGITASGDGTLTADIVECLAADKAEYDEAHPQTEAPQDNGRDYVLNTSSMKIHYPTCKDVKKIADHNRQDFHGTEEELLAQGYTTCGHCH